MPRHLDGRRAPKVVLSNDERIVAGVPCLVKVAAIHKPERDDRGRIEVEYVGRAPFKIEGVYLDPAVSRKLQVLLEDGLNILLDGPQGCGKTVLARSSADSLGMVFVFFNCGAVVEASDFFVTIQVRASPSGAPVTDFIKSDVLTALEDAGDGKRALPEILRTSFCGRFPGRWNDVTSDAGAVWAIVRTALAGHQVALPAAAAGS